MRPGQFGGGRGMSLETQNKDIPDKRVEGGHPSTDLVRECENCIECGDKERLLELARELHAADLGALFELLNKEDRVDLAEAIKGVLAPEVLTELEGEAFDDVIGVLEPEELAEALGELDTDDAVQVLEEIEDEDEQREVLSRVAAEERVAIEESLRYPEDSAGRLMQRDLVAVPPNWTVGQTIDFMRREKDLPDEFYEIFVVNPKHQPIGTIPLSRMMQTRRPVRVSEIMTGEQTLIPVDEDQEETAYRFRQYDLISAAVVDAAGRLVGVVTVDDIVDVIDEEAEEDILALAGVKEGDVNVSVMDITKTRFKWLLINLGTAIAASGVIILFEASIEKLVALAVLMPIVASMGGNAGAQTMTIAVRAIAMHELTSANVVRVLTKEILGSLINGSLLAVIIGVLSALWFDNNQLGMVIGAAMIINIVIAAFSGIFIPMTLDRFRIDPAVASTVVVTTITDVVGFFVFLGLAAVVLL
ncbi:MAG: magnesium transporter [Proteobacteria bacterium]|nr:magnesium transporter [Pseudomonadota bacterium]